MKLRKLTFIFLSCLIIFAGCKKNNDNQPDEEIQNPACDSSAKYKLSINEAIYPVSVYEAADGSIFIAGKNSSNAKVVRVSHGGALLNDNEYAVNPGSYVQNIIQLNDNGFLFSAANTESFDSMVCYPYTGWYSCCYQTDSNHECKVAYYFNTGTGMGNFTTTSVSQLFKIDSSLNIAWQKEFKGYGFNGRSLAKINDHDFAFMTYHCSGLVPYPVIDTFGVFLDTVNYNFYGNSVTVYDIDENGNVLWQKEIDNIYSKNLYAPDNGCEIVCDGTNIFIRMEHEIIILSLTGEILSRFNFNGFCDEEFLGIAAIEGNGFVCKGFDISGFYTNNFLARYNNDGVLVWNNASISSGAITNLSSLNGETFDYGIGHVVKYNALGISMWTRNFDSPANSSAYSSCGVASYNRGIIVVAGNGSNDLVIYKTDINGYFQ